jgi:hypothetical protein
VALLLETFYEDLKAFRKALKDDPNLRITKKSQRERAEQLGSRWFEEIGPDLARLTAFPPETLKKYSESCEHLIKLSAPNNRKTSYLATLEALIKPMRNELIIPIKSGAGGTTSPSAFDSFVSSLTNPEESAYFQEAIDCAKHGFLRAATVLCWCAAIDRIHRRIEQIGFSTFNVTSAQMASQQKGRFKRFNQSQSVTSLSELREVFDTTVLWVIEGMGLIDLNQHTRLRSCFEMRNHSAHPGDAPITPYNLMSFFSDIQQIVLENSKFQL